MANNKATAALLVCFASTLISLSTAQCDPPDYISAINVTCPSAEEAPDQSITYADPDHCSEYYECYNGCEAHLICTPGTLYDPLFGCNTAEDVKCGDRDCDGEPCNPDPTDAPADPDDCEEDGTFPYEDNCIKYILCSGGQGVIKTCPVSEDTVEQELWCEDCDDGNGWCDYPANVDCGDRLVCDENDENCEEQSGGGGSSDPCAGVECAGDEYVEEGACEKCTCECAGAGNTASELCCPEGYYWSPEEEDCLAPSDNPGC